MVFAQSLRGRLTLWYCSALAVFLSLFSVLLFGMVDHHLAHHHDAGLRVEAKLVLKVLEAHEDCLTLTPQQQEDLNRLGRLMVIHEVGGERRPFFTSMELSSHPMVETLSLRAKEMPPIETFDTISQQGNLWRILSLPYQSHAGRKGVIRIMEELGDIHETLDGLRDTLLWLTPLGILLSWVGGYWLSGRALAPINLVVERAEEIEATNLGQRLPHPGVDSEIGRLVNTLNRAFERLEASFESMRRFTADASHELRNPLATLRSTIDITLEQPRSPEEHGRVLESLGEEVDHLRSIVDDLLLLARADAGALQLKQEPLRLDVLAASQVEAHLPRSREAGIDLRLDSSPPISILGDERWMHQLVGNLLDNALKFTPEGGTVTIALSAEAGNIQLSVKDNGPGVPPEDLAKVFDRFYRSDPSRSRGEHPGTGLGLAIASWIAQMHGGRMEARNNPEGGACFCLILQQKA